MDPYKTVSKRSTTQILDFMGDVGGFYGALDILVFWVAQYFATKFYTQQLSKKLFKKKKKSKSKRKKDLETHQSELEKI
jgi:beta-lactamase regulating signal transducer with metallopeptidase domain